MKTALIGHRGVGKTSVLKRIEAYYSGAGRQVLCFDLDREIEKRTGRTISEIFSHDGEPAFRKIEASVFAEIDGEIDAETLVHARDVFIAIGAGFEPSRIPSAWKALWIRRPSDPDGRIFLDRPRLNASAPALDEFHQRFQEREACYRARADEVLMLTEGLDEHLDPVERDFFLGSLSGLGGALTLLPENFRSPFFERWIAARVRWGVEWFELRDDLLSAEQMETAIRHIPARSVLISFRDPARREPTEALLKRHGFAFDWPLEFGPAPTFAKPSFLSLHERHPGQSVADALMRFPKDLASGVRLKAALPIANFQELATGESWRSEFPETRVFLPHSIDGRWSWYRLWRASSQALGFFREGDGSGADQPTLLAWARPTLLAWARPALLAWARPALLASARPSQKNRHFAAVLGSPVAHSRTPQEQGEFFAAAGVPIFAIRVEESEWHEALSVLRSLGLKWAAVTAPLKSLAFLSCAKRDRMSEELRSINTLQLDDDGSWRGTNTDRVGFAAVIRSRKDLGAIAVWGGGGTLQMIKSVLPDAQLFSLRSGDNRDPMGSPAASFKPDSVFWAVGRSRADQGQVPPEWRPKLVIDLNYADDSPGRAFALERGARYVSGLEMFRAQAEAQRKFWEIP